MRIAILSAGLSLAKTWNECFRGCYDLTFAVNHAVLHARSDWIIAADRICYDRFIADRLDLSYCCGFVCMPGVEGFARHVKGLEAKPSTRTDVLSARFGYKDSLNFTINYAIAFAWYCGGRYADIYGHDMDGTNDIGGSIEPIRASRWPKEQKTYRGVVEHAATLGLKIKRVTDDR